MTDFTVRRVKNSFVQQFQAQPDKVFPLLCPVREYEWIEPWQCEMLHSDSGIVRFVVTYFLFTLHRVVKKMRIIHENK